MKDVKKIMVGAILLSLAVGVSSMAYGLADISAVSKQNAAHAETTKYIAQLREENIKTVPKKEIAKDKEVIKEKEVTKEKDTPEKKETTIPEVKVDQKGSKGIEITLRETKDKPIPKKGSNKEVKKEVSKKPPIKKNMTDAEITSMGKSIIDSMPNHLKKGLVEFRKAKPSEVTQAEIDSRVIAYVYKRGIYWVSPDIVKEMDYYLYHEMGHVWINTNPHFITPELKNAFEKEWRGKNHYGATNINEAVAETVSYIYTKRKSIPNTPTFLRLVKEALEASK